MIRKISGQWRQLSC